jgi:hypothetical protein
MDVGVVDLAARNAPEPFDTGIVLSWRIRLCGQDWPVIPPTQSKAKAGAQTGTLVPPDRFCTGLAHIILYSGLAANPIVVNSKAFRNSNRAPRCRAKACSTRFDETRLVC